MSQWVLNCFLKLRRFSVLQKLRIRVPDSGRNSKLSGKVGEEYISAARCSQSELALCTVQSAAKVPYGKMTTGKTTTTTGYYFYNFFNIFLDEFS